jgi:hypothetical protein
MEPFNEANIIVDRMLVEYFRIPEAGREFMPGSGLVKEAWDLITKEMENQELLDQFKDHPDDLQRPLTVRLARLMSSNDEVASSLRRYLDQYLQDLYSGTIYVKQEASNAQISNASGVIKGGSVIGIHIDSVDSGKVQIGRDAGEVEGGSATGVQIDPLGE